MGECLIFRRGGSGGSGGGLVPQIAVIAPANSTIDIMQGAVVLQTYTYGASETMHTFDVASGSYTVRATKGTDTKSESITVSGVSQETVKIAYRLPSGYLEVEYIQPNNTTQCWINTGCPITTSYLHYTVGLYGYLSASNETLNVGFDSWGCATTSDSSWGGQWWWKNGFYFGSSSGRSSSLLKGSTYYDLDILANNRSYTITANGISASGSYSGSFTTQNVYIFGSNRGNSIQNRSYWRCYYFKIHNSSNVLQRHLVPCIDPSGRTGMYDLVNSVFYGNSGTGEFLTGGVV